MLDFFCERFLASNSFLKLGVCPTPTPLVLQGVKNEKLSNPTRFNRALAPGVLGLSGVSLSGECQLLSSLKGET